MSWGLRPEFYFPSQMKEANIPAEKEEGLVKKRWRDERSRNKPASLGEPAKPSLADLEGNSYRIAGKRRRPAIVAPDRGLLRFTAWQDIL